MQFKFHLRYLGIALVAGLGFGLRFWQLSRFNSLVFDEVYYVKFAQAYLAGEAVFDAHPPMGKYAIAAGIWLYEHIPWPHVASQALTAEVSLPTVSYRWMNALAGSLVPLIVVGLVNSLTAMYTATQKVSKGWNFGILAGTFVAIDGLFVTESRYGLLNIYLVLFGLLGHWLWIAAKRECRPVVKSALSGVSGISLGAAITTKWNGLGYVLALVIWESWQQLRNKPQTTAMPSDQTSQQQTIFQRVFYLILYLGLLPLLTYSLLWWPHMQLNEDSFLSIHHTLFWFHQSLEDVQAACSQWFTWPLLIKPISYWYEEAGTLAQEQVFAVNNLGNPALWWLSGSSVLLLGIERLSQLRLSIQHRSSSVTDYLLIGYLANWLPWMLVTRCTYNYLHMPAAVFGFMLLAWLMSRWLRRESPVSSRWFGFFMLGAIALAFFFWLPLSLGLPLSAEQLQIRWWLPSWI